MNSTHLILILINFVIMLKFNEGCIELLNGQWSQMSVEERIEKADKVLIIRIIEKIKPSSKTIKFYAAKCQIIDVLKGWQNFKRNSNEIFGWKNSKNIIINGFGSTLDCLSDVVENEIYIFFGMFKVDMNLWARYFTSFGAVEVLTSETYERSLSILGLHHWSSWSTCTKKCEVGIQERKRGCVLINNCDYSWTVQSKICNWQSCDNIILTNNDFSNKDFIDWKTINGDFTRNILISILFKNQTTQQIKFGEIFSIKLINDDGTLIRLSLYNDATIEIESGYGNKPNKFSMKNLLFVKNDDISINIAINDLGIIFESFCKNYSFYQYQYIIQKFFNSTIQRLHSKMAKDVTIKITTDNLEVYNKLFCNDPLYNHSSGIPSIQSFKPPQIKSQTINIVSTDIPKSNWSACSVTCGVGWQRRYNPCVDDECTDSDNENFKAEIRTCFIKENCQDNSCNVKCQNNGHCVKGKCFCDSGYQGEFCQFPICMEKCKNNGKCNGPNKCQCDDGYEGKFCEKLKCELKCLNGGQCLTPNKCTCAFGFTGRFCDKRKCNPSCKNGGKCQKGNICSCPDGVIGTRCEKYECYPQCMNGGSCVAKNKCQCPSEFSGSFCETHQCYRCYNGGKCVDSMCQCPTGYYGSECQSKICITGLKFKKIIKPVILQFPIIVSNRMCIESTCKVIQPQRSVIVNKVIFKPYIDCI